MIDELRRVRFLWPPCVFLLFVAGYAICTPEARDLIVKEVKELPADNWGVLVGALISGTVVLMALGYLLSTVPIFVMFIVSCLLRLFTWGAVEDIEVFVRKFAQDAIAARLPDANEAPSTVRGGYAKYAVIWYDHCQLPKSLHEWAQRHWDAYRIALNCAAAIGLSVLAWGCTGYAMPDVFRWIAGGFSVILLVHGFVSWRRVYKMLEFCAEHGIRESETKEEGDEGGGGKDKVS